MARLIRALRNSFHSLHSSSSSLSNSKIIAFRFQHINPNVSPQSPRTFYTSLRKINDYLPRIIRNEIQFEIDRFPLNLPNREYKSFTVDHRPGEKWVALRSKFGDKEDIKIEATMINESAVPASKVTFTSDSVIRRIHMVISINKQGISDNDGLSLEIHCTAWPKRIKIDELGTRKLGHIRPNSYFSPYFKDLDDKLIKALYVFLKERGIDDDLAVFLHSYMRNKAKVEYISWMENLIHFVEKQ